MKKSIFLLLLNLMAGIAISTAQTKSLPGKVTEDNGTPVPSASIKIKGKNTGAVSGDDGSFSIPSTGKGTLVISAAGFEETEVEVTGLQPVSITLKRSGKQLDEVVVTAFGIKRGKNTLPYAAQQINGDEVNRTRITNVASGLSGKISGLQITQGNAIGGSVNVVIRGSKSLSGNNQALFVVDGVPVDNTTNNSSSERNGAAVMIMAMPQPISIRMMWKASTY